MSNWDREAVLKNSLDHTGSRIRNERGKILDTIVTETNMVIPDIFLIKPAHRLYTWKSPRDLI